MALFRLATLAAAVVIGVISSPATAQQSAATTEKAKHGAWSIRCLQSDATVCAMTQIGNNASGEPLLRAEFHKSPTPQQVEGRTILGRMVITVPIGVLLPAGVQLSIDGRAVGAAGYQVCNPQQCVVAELVSDEFVGQLKKGSNVTMTIRGVDGKEASATLSLTGYTKAFNSL